MPQVDLVMFYSQSFYFSLFFILSFTFLSLYSVINVLAQFNILTKSFIIGYFSNRFQLINLFFYVNNVLSRRFCNFCLNGYLFFVGFSRYLFNLTQSL